MVFEGRDGIRRFIQVNIIIIPLFEENRKVWYDAVMMTTGCGI